MLYASIYSFSYGKDLYKHPISEAQKKKILRLMDEFTRPLKKKMVFYRWQAKEGGDILLKAKTYDDSSFNYFMSMEPDTWTLRAGQGIYIAENPVSAHGYLPKDRPGSLIEVHVAKGTPFLDIFDPDFIKEMNKRDVNIYDVAHILSDRVIKYEPKKGFSVIKTQKGISFKSFKGRYLSTDELIKYNQQFRRDDAQKIYLDSIKETVKKRSKKDHKLFAKEGFASLLDETTLMEVINHHLGQNYQKKELSEIIKTLNSNTELSKLAIKNKKFRKKFFQALGGCNLNRMIYSILRPYGL